ncbi:NAD-dependent succinate-semialdehyde dehydrogenase [Paraburkholderia caribensis]|jgi:succinate-semialdehyde dehydrogenase/glutarate-semialdehyde dehydrogenase|uniref:Succinate-semialdehyde dehydrogenase n=1 Tax=Paraburkholderia caribensis TaxID=75105 RepID=A0A9Q6S9R8_9BURK|nr:NAD-dependent succinate-semialdehyde dehydrogenase [Paraburkholderia caribensis]MCO4882243.1 NAD-dependent succinate-semialdehyde dehydrogenase [Paraburkholderia caribensis]MDR6380947.1 succinate-semialdehyde dehydrogenase/glutarate-semialdehyde dehydrogenase [Paraburkholderia caribensis]PTB29736.1 succinate-semialdehyde dehydrogenase [Paraburkholderia caribensis]QLB67420.1 succinate-semialdehyde dehydrogenase [Paraburkholderia caribensis]
MPYTTTNPATGELLATYDDISDALLETKLAAAQRAFETDWRRRPVSDRARIVSRAATLLREKADEYAGYLTLEMGKRSGEARKEVESSANILDYYAKHAHAYLQPRLLDEAPGAAVHIEPIGVLFGIEPWNFPYYQIARVAGPQLMVGNVLLLKHAESVPQSALAFARLFEEAGAPEGVYTNLFISIEQAGRVIDDPRVQGVTLTGSERAGAAVAERAGRNLKKVVLELGGSDPFIVLDDAPLDWAIESAVAGRMLNAGQCCVGSKRIIVVGKERGAAFLEGFAQRMAALETGDPADPSTAVAPLSSERALKLLLEQIDRAVSHGARIVCGGKRVARAGFYLQPTVLTDISPQNPVFAEELFGPVAAFHIVDDEAAAIALANGTPYGLGASVFTANTGRGEGIAAQIDSGMVFINQPFGTSAELPFGGIKRSGFGRELSLLGFDEFVNKKLIRVAPVGASPFGPARAV